MERLCGIGHSFHLHQGRNCYIMSFTAELSGSYTSSDKFTVYYMDVTAPNGQTWKLERRYREFKELHDHLKLKYPERIPTFPGKRLFWSSLDPEFVRQRQEGLQAYIAGVLRIEPEPRTRVLQRFLETHRLSDSGAFTGRRGINSPHEGPANLPLSTRTPGGPQQKDTHEDSFIDTAAVREKLNGLLFDLQVQPVLLDREERDRRLSRYQAVLAEKLLLRPVPHEAARRLLNWRDEIGEINRDEIMNVRMIPSKIRSW